MITIDNMNLTTDKNKEPYWLLIHFDSYTATVANHIKYLLYTGRYTDYRIFSHCTSVVFCSIYYKSLKTNKID